MYSSLCELDDFNPTASLMFREISGPSDWTITKGPANRGVAR